MKRSTLLGLTAAGAVAAAAPARAQAETVRLGSIAVEDAALSYFAQELGYFQHAGLTVNVTYFAGGGAVTQAILAGAVDCGVTNSGSMTLAHARGIPLYLLACGAIYTQASPVGHLVVPKNSSIKNAKDFTGKTIAVSSLKDMVQAGVLAWIDKNGGTSSAVNFIELPTVQQAAAIAQKRVDGAALVEPFFTNAKNDLTDLGTIYGAVNDGKPFQTLGFAASKTWFDQNAATGRRVATALHATAKWANDPKNRAHATAMLATLTKLDAAVIASYPRIAYAEANTPGLVQPVIDLLAKYAFIAKSFPETELLAPGVP